MIHLRFCPNGSEPSSPFMRNMTIDNLGTKVFGSPAVRAVGYFRVFFWNWKPSLPKIK